MEDATTHPPSTPEWGYVSSNDLAYYVLLVSMYLQGVANSFRYGPLFYVYVDDNILDKTRTGIYLAISYVFADFVGPVGDLVNSYLSTIPVDLKDTTMSRDDPRFVSAWWVSFLVFGACTIVASLPIILLPRRMVPLERQQRALQQALVTFAGGELNSNVAEGVSMPNPLVSLNSGARAREEEEGEDTESEMQSRNSCRLTDASFLINERGQGERGAQMLGVAGSRSSKSAEPKTLWSVVKDFPRSIYRVLSNPLYALVAVEFTVIYFLLFGIRPFQVKYIMFEYEVSMAKTNFAKGVTSAVTHILGVIIGSALSTRISTSMGYLKLILITAAFAFLITPFYIVFGCDNEPVVGLKSSPTALSVSTINETCHCDPSLNLLACGSDGLNYLSPCFAGCTETNGTDFFHCDFLNSTEHGKQARPGVCDVDCDNNFIIFNVLVAAHTFVFSINNMPRHLLTLRILNPEDRAFGSAFMHFVPFLAALPAPMLFGAWIESMCSVWTFGHCSLYDRDSIRYLTGGIEIFVAALTVATYIVMVWICRWMDKKLLLTSMDSMAQLVVSDPTVNTSVDEACSSN